MIPQGYKQTEVGVIPEEWKCVQLGDVSKVTKLAGFEFTKYIVYSNQGDIIALRGLNVKNGKLILDDVKYIDNSDFSKLSRSKLFKNDLLFTYVGTVGEVALVDRNDKYYLAPNVALIRLNAGISPVFCMKQILSTAFYKEQIQLQVATSSQPAISMANIRLFNIVLPPLPEQERIAEALSNVDGMIFSLEKLIAKKKAVKQGAVQELLTGKKRLRGFDERWVKVKLNDVFDFYKGNGLSKEKITADGKNSCILYGELFTRYSEVINEIANKTNYDEGFLSCSLDVLMPGSTTTNGLDLATASVIMKDNVLLGGDIVVLRPKIEMDTRIFGYLFRMMAKEILQHTQGITIVHLNTKTFQEMEALIPKTVAEQTAIASIFSDMDNEIEALEQKLAKTRQIKQGMMQQLLTGKIRLLEEQTATAIVQPAIIGEKEAHNHYFDDAVAIAAIVNAFYSERYSLGRKRVQKLLYLLRRKQEADTSAFKKKAAGPYADEVRYRGGEPIAKKNGYITAITSKKGTVFSKGEHIESALSYVEKWEWKLVFDWLIDKFKYTKTDELELLATIDMAMCDLTHTGDAITVDTIKNLIASNPEWKAKLSKTFFKDSDIAWAITMCKQLF